MSKAKLTPGGVAAVKAPPSVRRQSAVRARVAKPAPKAALPGIIDGVRDQNGALWLHFGTSARSTWFQVADLINDAPSVFRRLSGVGATLLTAATQTAFKRNVESYDAYREALVASRPGWHDGFYVYGDGTTEDPRGERRKVIIAFEGNPKFAPQGSLKSWQAAVGPFVVGQPLVQFVLGLALVGPLLRLAPSGYLNPQVEIVGPGETGKTILGVLAASVWAGNPDSDVGGGETWDTTSNALEDVKLAHRDGFAFFDEGNLTGTTPRAQQEFAQHAVFKIGTTGGKHRKGDPVVGEHARLSVLSTTNTSLVDLLKSGSDAEKAAQSRMVTILIAPDAPYGVLASIPPGFATSRAAIEALRQAVDQHWGAAGEAFISKLVDECERDEEHLRGVVSRVLARYISCSTPDVSARGSKTFALVRLATAMACYWGVFPPDWDSFDSNISGIASNKRGRAPQPGLCPHLAIREYVVRHRRSLRDVANLTSPLSVEDFESSAGFWRRDERGTQLLVPAGHFQDAFPAYRDMMRTLRDDGSAKTEGGNKPKLTIKTPKAICDEGRVYCIYHDVDAHY